MCCVARSPVGAVVAVGLVAGAGSAAADDVTVDTLPAVTDRQLAASISDILLPEPIDVVRERRDDGERVIDLDSDLLFAFDSAELAAPGVARIRTEVQTLPRGTALAIGGHTDSVGASAYNRRLSLARAEAVADAVRAARSDLLLTVRGYGETQPVVPNRSGGEDDAAARSLNRRVELRVAG